MHHWSTTVSSFSPLKTIRFPPRASGNRLHVFAITLVPAYAPVDDVSASLPAVSVKNVRLTTLKTDGGDSIVQVTLANLRALASPSYRYASHGITGRKLSRQSTLDGGQHPLPLNRQNDQPYEYEHYTSSVLSGPHEVIIRATHSYKIWTTSPGKVFRLMPGDDVRVDVGVTFENECKGLVGWVKKTLGVIGVSTSLLNIFSDSARKLEVE
ncbi:hypothetical protein FRC07_003229, partial [Ceratobasidium sp. 392]